mmetsp:Transcript_93306/g.216920  ORF Transcript_93306/g.216920 Transcript_93306/m.216920 type:complete len:209 (+) Transcript_93306:855-1481(+)
MVRCTSTATSADASAIATCATRHPSKPATDDAAVAVVPAPTSIASAADTEVSTPKARPRSCSGTTSQITAWPRGFTAASAAPLRSRKQNCWAKVAVHAISSVDELQRQQPKTRRSRTGKRLNKEPQIGSAREKAMLWAKVSMPNSFGPTCICWERALKVAGKSALSAVSTAHATITTFRTKVLSTSLAIARGSLRSAGRRRGLTRCQL